MPRDFLSAITSLATRMSRAVRNHRLRTRLRGTVAERLGPQHLDGLDLLDLVQRLGRPRVIYDIGACEGTWALMAKASCPQAEIHAFEPLVVHHELFLNLAPTRPENDITLHKVAVGERSGSLEMHVASRADCSSPLSLLPAFEREGVREARLERVSVVRLDDYVREKNLPPADLVKLDVQGYERQVIEGAGVCLANARFVIVELSFQELYARQDLYESVLNALHRHAFRLTAFSGDVGAGRQLVQADALFVRRGGPRAPI